MMSYFSLKKLLFQTFAHAGFVKACPVGWIPTTRLILYIIIIYLFLINPSHEPPWGNIREHWVEHQAVPNPDPVFFFSSLFDVV